MFGRISRIEARREAEYQGALGIRSAAVSHSQSVLIAGNSLLLEGVDFPELQREVAPHLELRRAVVEGTYYLDWYYGLRRLFDEGARPDAVVLVLNPIQLTSKAVEGDYTAHFLVERKDLLDFANDTGADRNRLSSLVLANYSFFYGTRAEIRNWLMGKILPDLPSLTHSFRPDPSPPDTASFRELAIRRLGQLYELCREQRTEVVVVIPPSNTDLGASDLSEMATTLKLKVLVPIAPGVLPRSDYSDGFHLNSRGAREFTPALALALKQNFLGIGTDRRQTATQTESTDHHPSLANSTGGPSTDSSFSRADVQRVP